MHPFSPGAEPSSLPLQSTQLLKIEGPPGSGKTRELARELCRLIAEEGIQPAEVRVLAMTPMNRRRIRAYIQAEAELAGMPAPEIEIQTWDEFLLEARNRPSAESAVRKQKLLSDGDACVLLQGILQQEIVPGHPWFLASRQAALSRVCFELLRQCRLQGVDAARLQALSLAAPAGSSLPLLARVAGRFQEHLAAAGLVYSAELLPDGFQNSVSALVILPTVRWILVDEAQELSEGHHRLLASLGCSLMLAGNAQFSIRRFRKAEPQLFQSLAPGSGLYDGHEVTPLPKLACMRGNEPILSMLNHCLPQPVWEEQEPDIERLAKCVSLAAYADPAAEAEAVAETIAALVCEERQGDESGRPVGYDDCLILLRSSRYKEHIVQALVQRGIPFRSDEVSEVLVQVQHRVYDFLKTVQACQALELNAALWESPAALGRHLEALPMSGVEKEDWMGQINRHWRRWLEAGLSDAVGPAGHWLPSLEDSPGNLSHLAAFLPLALAQSGALNPVLQELVSDFKTLIRLYETDACPVTLLAQYSAHLLARWADADTQEEVSQGLKRFQEGVARLDGYYRQTLGTSLPLGYLLENYVSLWEQPEAHRSSQAGPEVRLSSLHQVQGEEAAFVFIPFLVAEEFPQMRQGVELLSVEDVQALGIEPTYRVDEAEEWRLLAMGMSRAIDGLYLSRHRTEAGQSVLSSPFYQRLLSVQNRLLGRSHPSQSTAVEAEASVLDGNNALAKRYVSDSVWANLEAAAAEPLFDEQEMLCLSASSIKTYMTCPRQFYYRHLLRLRLPDNEAAAVGLLIHRLIEVFNRTAGAGEYTAERLLDMAQQMFAFEEEPERFAAAGFEPKDARRLRQLSPLGFSTLRERLAASVADLEAKGYFERYGGHRGIEAEKELAAIALPGIDRVRFTGVLDALIALPDGTFDIVDYKTFRRAYSTRLDTCDKHFRGVLEPLPEDEDLEHAERFAGKLSASYPKDYQLPLYYLACNQDPAYQGKINGAALQIIRPAFVDNPSQGAIRLELPGREIEECAPQLLEDLNRYIVEPIVGAEVFEPEPGHCQYCDYAAICDAGSDGEADE